MRMFMFVAALATTLPPLQAEEPPPSRLRELVHAMIMESLPNLPALPIQPSAAPAEPVVNKVIVEDDVVVLEPIVVSESNGVRAVTRLIAREQQRAEAETFKVLEGGTLFRRGRLKIGTWAGRDGGLDLLRIDF